MTNTEPLDPAKQSDEGTMSAVIAGWLSTHEKSINDRFESVDEKIANLATKKDIEEITRIFNAVSTAMRITSKGSSISYKAILMLASLLVALAVIWSFAKGGLTSVASHITHSL